MNCSYKTSSANEKSKQQNLLEESLNSIEETLKSMDDNLNESQDNDKHLLTCMHLDQIKNQGLFNQLEEAKKENKQLLNILQQRCGENDLSKRSSQIDLATSCSTMSMVNLQYKYEELLASHNGLLKILDMRISEVQKVHEENEKLKTELETMSVRLNKYENRCHKLREKIRRVKSRKDERLSKMLSEIDALKIVHNQLVDLLHKQCMERDANFADRIRNCGKPEKALLLQEIRKNNLLTYENFKLRHHINNLNSNKERSNDNHVVVGKNSAKICT